MLITPCLHYFNNFLADLPASSSINTLDASVRLLLKKKKKIYILTISVPCLPFHFQMVPSIHSHVKRG